MSEQNKLGASKHSTRRNGLRYCKQSDEGQITQPCYAVSYLSHREPKALCTAHLTQHSPGLGPGGGGRTALQQPSAWDTRAFPNAPGRLCTAPDTCKSFVSAAFLLAYGLSNRQERIQSTSARNRNYEKTLGEFLRLELSPQGSLF